MERRLMRWQHVLLGLFGFALFVVSGCGSGGASSGTPAPNGNPAPAITSLSPVSVMVGLSTQSLTINGSNFISTTTVTFNGTARAVTLVNSAQLMITLSAIDLATAGTYQVVVTNPSPGGGTASATLPITNPSPSVSSVSPAVLATGSPATVITVGGNNFLVTSQILINGGFVSTTFVSSTELTADIPATFLASGTSVAVAVSNTPPGGGTSSAVALQLVSVATLALLATPANTSNPTGPWLSFVVARNAAGNPIAGLPISMAASQGTLNIGQGLTDANGSFSVTLTPPGGITASEAVGLVATIGGQSVSASLVFTGISGAAIRTGNSATALRARLGSKPIPESSSSSAIVPVAIGISMASPGSTSPFAGPNYCYSPAALSTTETTQCATLFQEQNISLQPSNPFQAVCNAATVADTVVNVGECVGTAVTIVSCLASETGIGAVVCAATLGLTATTLAPDCAAFILGEVTGLFSPSAETAEELVELSVDPSSNPLDYIVTACDVSNSTTNQSSGSAVAPVAGNGAQGYSNGPALSISLNSPTGIAFDASGNVYFDDDGNNVIRKLTTANGQVTTVVGTGVAGYTGDGGLATAATLNHPTQLVFDTAFNLYIADADNNVVRKVTPGGIISTVAGTGVAGFSGDGGNATHAMLNFPDSLAIDAAGDLYIADAGNNRIRKVASNGVITTVAGNGIGSYGGDNGFATNAELNEPTRVALDAAGNLYISDFLNNRVRKVNISSGIITTLAGNGTAGYAGDGGAASNAELNGPISLILDSSGNVYIADLENKVIRVVNMQSTSSTLLGIVVQPGNIATVVGGGAQSDLNPGATLNVALSYPTGLLTDTGGNLYFADADNNVILRADKGG
jgi:sugar lactone lactonase YvrE